LSLRRTEGFSGFASPSFGALSKRPSAARIHEFLRNPVPLQAPGFNFDMPHAVARQLPVLYANLKKLYDSGVTVVTGSDSPGGLTSLLEIILHVEAGLTPMQALRAATINAQKMIGRDKDAGAIAAGKIADLVLLDGNPLSDIRNIARLNRVFRAGVALYPAGQSPTPDKATVRFHPEIPRTWSDRDLADWATPVAGLNVGPGTFRRRSITRLRWTVTEPIRCMCPDGNPRVTGRCSRRLDPSRSLSPIS
jgi:hypothetical protein